MKFLMFLYTLAMSGMNLYTVNDEHEFSNLTFKLQLRQWDDHDWEAERLQNLLDDAHRRDNFRQIMIGMCCLIFISTTVCFIYIGYNLLQDLLRAVRIYRNGEQNNPRYRFEPFIVFFKSFVALFAIIRYILYEVWRRIGNDFVHAQDD